MDASVTIDYVKYKHATWHNYHTTFCQIMFSKINLKMSPISKTTLQLIHLPYIFITVQLSLHSIDLPAILGDDVFNYVRLSLQSVNLADNFSTVQLFLQSVSLLSIHIPCIFIHIYDCFIFIAVFLLVNHNFQLPFS